MASQLLCLPIYLSFSSLEVGFSLSQMLKPGCCLLSAGWVVKGIRIQRMGRGKWILGVIRCNGQKIYVYRKDDILIVQSDVIAGINGSSWMRNITLVMVRNTPAVHCQFNTTLVA